MFPSATGKHNKPECYYYHSCCVPPIHQINVPGRLLAIIFATRFSCRARNTSHALSLGWRPFFDLGHNIFHAVNALADKFLIFPLVFEDMPHDTPNQSQRPSRGENEHIHLRVAAVRVNLGSQTITGALFCSFAFITCIKDTGCASVGFPPIMNMALGVVDIVVRVCHLRSPKWLATPATVVE